MNAFSKLDAKSIGLVIAGAVLAVATVWIHYEVKAKLVPASGFGMALDGMSAGGSNFQLGDPIADFSSTTLEGESITLSDFQNQQVVVLDFWATWCKPCVNGMPGLQTLHEELGDRGVQILAVNVGEDAETIQEFMQSEGYSFPVVMDPDRNIKDLFGVKGIPQLFVVDKEGNLRHSKVGGPMSAGHGKSQAKKLGFLLEKLVQESSSATS